MLWQIIFYYLFKRRCFLKEGIFNVEELDLSKASDIDYLIGYYTFVATSKKEVKLEYKSKTDEVTIYEDDELVIIQGEEKITFLLYALIEASRRLRKKRKDLEYVKDSIRNSPLNF